MVFHSYKGGVGRTMAVLNFARALCALKKRVLVLDLDVDAPGLHLKPGILPTNGDDEDPIKGTIPDRGYVDYLAHFHDGEADGWDIERGTGRWEKSVDSAKFEEDRISFLKKFCVGETNVTDPTGDSPFYKYIPAGIGNERYWWNLSSKWFHDFFAVSRNEYSSNGTILLHENRLLFETEKEILRQIYDKGTEYLLVDCKSAREYSSAPLYYWADVVVSMFPANEEGAQGACRMYSAVTQASSSINRQVRVLPVICRVRTGFDVKSLLSGESNANNPSTNFGERVRKLRGKIKERAPLAGAESLPFNDYRSSGGEPDLFLSESDFDSISESFRVTVEESMIVAHQDQEFVHGISWHHQIIEDHGRLYSRIFRALSELGLSDDSDQQLGRETKIGTVRTAPQWVKVLIIDGSEPRRDISLHMNRLGQAINADGEFNVLLRTETVRLIFSSLAKYLTQLNVKSKQTRRVFRKTGRKVGLSFGEQIIGVGNHPYAKIVDPGDDYRTCITKWCKYDSDDAGFGILEPTFGTEEFSGAATEIAIISWKNCFLSYKPARETSCSPNGAQNDSGKEFANVETCEFLVGYVQGIIQAILLFIDREERVNEINSILYCNNGRELKGKVIVKLIEPGMGGKALKPLDISGSTLKFGVRLKCKSATA